MSHYFDESPAAPSASIEQRVELPIEGATLTMRTDRGVFSHGRLDPGTALLLREAPGPPPTGTLLDLGCGAGPITLAMAGRSPGATVWAIDVNERARQLTADNAAVNGLSNVTVVAPDEIPEDVRFDAIWTNPPIRIGKSALHELLSTWLSRLTPAGEAVLVVHRHLGADSLQRWLTDEGWSTDRLASKRGYRILRAGA